MSRCRQEYFCKETVGQDRLAAENQILNIKTVLQRFTENSANMRFNDVYIKSERYWLS